MPTVAQIAIDVPVLGLVGLAQTCLLLIAVMMLGVWLSFAILLRKQHWVPIVVRQVPIDPDGMDSPPEFASACAVACEVLAPLGFSLAECFARPNYSAGANGYLAVLVNRETLEWVWIATGISGADASMRVVHIAMFRSEFDGEVEVMTTNSRTLSFYPPYGRGLHAMHFPEIEGLDRLHQVHRARAAKIGEGLAARDLQRNGLQAQLEKDQRRLCAHLVECGYYYADEPNGLLRLTRKGACLVASKLLWPISRIRIEHAKLRARNEQRRLGIV